MNTVAKSRLPSKQLLTRSRKGLLSTPTPANILPGHHLEQIRSMAERYCFEHNLMPPNHHLHLDGMFIPIVPTVSFSFGRDLLQLLQMPLRDAFLEYEFPSYDRRGNKNAEKKSQGNTQKTKFFTRLSQAFPGVTTVGDLVRLNELQLLSPFGKPKIGHLKRWYKEFGLILGVNYTAPKTKSDSEE